MPNPHARVHRYVPLLKLIDPAPIGLCIESEIDNPNNLQLRTWVNGLIRQDSRTQQLIFTVQDIIAYLPVILSPRDHLLISMRRMYATPL